MENFDIFRFSTSTSACFMFCLEMRRRSVTAWMKVTATMNKYTGVCQPSIKNTTDVYANVCDSQVCIWIVCMIKFLLYCFHLLPTYLHFNNCSIISFTTFQIIYIFMICRVTNWKLQTQAIHNVWVKHHTWSEWLNILDFCICNGLFIFMYWINWIFDKFYVKGRLSEHPPLFVCLFVRQGIR